MARKAKKTPAGASQKKFGHLNIERSKQPTDKQAKQLIIVSAENLQEDIDDSIQTFPDIFINFKNRALTGMYTENICNDK